MSQGQLIKRQSASPAQLAEFLPLNSAFGGNLEALNKEAEQMRREEAERKLKVRIEKMRKYEEKLLRQAEAELAGPGEGSSEASGTFISTKQRKHYEMQRTQAKANLAAIELLEQEREVSVQGAIDAALSKIEADRAIATTDDEKQAVQLASKALSRATTLLQENTRPEVAHLLAALDLDVNVALSAKDNQALMQALLTCNEDQLDVLYNNPKVPISVKIVIKRLKEDLKVGNMGSVERLWDRVFGKPIPIEQQQPAVQVNVGAGQAQMQAPLSSQRSADQEAAALLRGEVSPNTPLSREAYVLIRETYMTTSTPKQPKQPEDTGEDVDFEQVTE